MAAKYIYSIATGITLLNSAAFGHVVQCDGITAPAGSYNDFSLCTNSEPPLYAPLTETLTSITASFACETACYTRGHDGCSFAVYDAGIQTCAIYHSFTPPGPLVDVASAWGVSNTIFLNTICGGPVCGQVYNYNNNDYLIKCSANSDIAKLTSCMVTYNYLAGPPPVPGLYFIIASNHVTSTCFPGYSDGCTFSPDYEYAIYLGINGNTNSSPVCPTITTTTTTATSTELATISTSASTSSNAVTTSDTTTVISSTSTAAGTDSKIPSPSSTNSLSTFSVRTTGSVMGSSINTSKSSLSSSLTLSSSSASSFSSSSSSSSSSISPNRGLSTTSASATASSEISISFSPTSGSPNSSSVPALPSSTSNSPIVSAVTTTEPTCPRDDGRLYSSQAGNVYEIECDEITGPGFRERAAEEKRQTPSNSTTYVTCINSCDFITGCLSIIYTLSSGKCRVFTAFMLPTPGVEFGAQLRVLASGVPVSDADTPNSGVTITANSNANITKGVNITVIDTINTNITITNTITTTSTTVLFLGCPVIIICTTGLCGVITGVCLACQAIKSSPVPILPSNQHSGTQISDQAVSQSNTIQTNPISISTPQLNTNSGIKPASSSFLFLFVVPIPFFT